MFDESDESLNLEDTEEEEAVNRLTLPGSRLPAPSNSDSDKPKIDIDSQETMTWERIFLILSFGGLVVGLVVAIVYLVINSNKFTDYKAKYQKLRDSPCKTEVKEINSTYNRDTVTQSIQETTRLNNSYMIMYDNKQVDYRNAYYENLSVATMQAWQPVLVKVYTGFLFLYAVFLFVFQSANPLKEKIKSFVMVAVLSNLYVLKFVVSVIILGYNHLKNSLPFLFLY